LNRPLAARLPENVAVPRERLRTLPPAVDAYETGGPTSPEPCWRRTGTSPAPTTSSTGSEHSRATTAAGISARFTVSDPTTGQECEVDIRKEIFWGPIAHTAYGPVLAEEDVIGTKVRALADRGAPRDLIDVFAASRRWTTTDLEEFGRRHARGRFEREDLQANLAGAEWTDDDAFTAYGLDGSAIAALRAWAVEWADSLATRLHEETDSLDTD
jgi:nucleotidyltransferase AbiEii toxin of type IV toxin-antitoxin system